MTISVLIALATVGMLAMALWSIICRVNLMKHKVTRDRVFVQHSLAAFALLGGIIMPDPYSKLMLAAGWWLYLLMGAPRWRFGAPHGTIKPVGQK